MSTRENIRLIARTPFRTIIHLSVNPIDTLISNKKIFHFFINISSKHTGKLKYLLERFLSLERINFFRQKQNYSLLVHITNVTRFFIG